MCVYMCVFCAKILWQIEICTISGTTAYLVLYFIINHVRYQTNSVKVLLCPLLPDIRRVHKLHPLVPLIIAISVLRWEWIWSIDGMIPATKRQNTRRKGCPSARLCTAVGRGSNPGLRREMPATDQLIHGTAWSMKFFRITRVRNSVVLTSQETHCSSIMTTSQSVVFREMLACCENHTVHIRTLYGQGAKFVNRCGTYSYHRVLLG